MANRLTQYPLFPLIDIQREPAFGEKEKITLTSTIRLLHTDGLWYRLLVKDESLISAGSEIDYPIKNFIKNVYLAQVISIIDTDGLVGTDMVPVFRPDKDQRTEKQRLHEDIIQL